MSRNTAAKKDMFIVSQDPKPEEPQQEIQNAPAPPSLKDLFESYGRLDAAVAEARIALEKAIVVRSRGVATILEAHGKGPFRWNGDLLTAVKRGQVTFFRGKSTPDVIEVG